MENLCTANKYDFTPVSLRPEWISQVDNQLLEPVEALEPQPFLNFPPFSLGVKRQAEESETEAYFEQKRPSGSHHTSRSDLTIPTNDASYISGFSVPKIQVQKLSFDEESFCNLGTDQDSSQQNCNIQSPPEPQLELKLSKPKVCSVPIEAEKLADTLNEPKWRSERIRKALLRHFKRYFMTSFDRYVKSKAKQSKLHIDTVDLLRIAHEYLEERGLTLPEDEENKNPNHIVGSDAMSIGFLLLAYNGSKLTFFIESHPQLFSQYVLDSIKENQVLDALFKGAHKLRNESDFKTFIADKRIQILWRKFIKTCKHEIFNSMETNAIRGRKNLEHTQELLNEVSSHTGIQFKLIFE